MWFTAITVAVGALIGLAVGGRPRHLPEHSFHLWPLLLSGLMFQVLVEANLAGEFGVPLVLASYGLLILFALLNLRLAGMGVVLVGMALNLVVIAANWGMPVRASAIAQAGLAPEERAQFVSLRGERHLEEPDDRLTVLSDIIPIRPIRQVVSFGDLVLGVGTATLIVGLLRPPRKKVWRPD